MVSSTPTDSTIIRADIEIGFNSKYLLDITNQIIGDTMRFELSDSVSPAIIRDMGDKRAVYVLMPMRV